MSYLRTEATAAPIEGIARHGALVRITHWLIVLSVFGLLASGIGILISHPRLYWGETGGVGTESLLDLPIPFIIGPSVWNRPYHFFFAWLLVLSALVYVFGGLFTGHFRRDLLPAKAAFRWHEIRTVIVAHLRLKRDRADEAHSYNVLQRVTYLAVVFVLFPAMVLTGLGMSPGVTSVFPFLATALGGHQSARTLHFVFASLLALFLIVHVLMLIQVGFVRHMRAMITGRISSGRSIR